MYEVAERFYMGLIPQARELVEHALGEGKTDKAKAVNAVIDGILERPEHAWFTEGAEEQAAQIQKAMEHRYGGADSGK
jgi:hypothetical protein